MLFVQERTGSYAVAGLTAAAFALGNGAVAPLQARLIDRLGHWRVLLPLAVGQAVALTAIVPLVLGGAPDALVIVVALLGGVSNPALSSAQRTLWPGLLDGRERLLPTAFALDSVTTELCFTLGPLLAALCATLASPQAGLVVSAALVLGGTATFVGAAPSRAWRGSTLPRSGGRLGALSSSGLRTVVLATLPIGLAFGAAEVTMTGAADALGHREASGYVIALWSLASAAGGLVLGARAAGSTAARRLVLMGSLLPLGFLPLVGAPSVVVLAVLAPLAGVLIAPTLAACYQLAGELAPSGTRTEAYTWPVTALVTGIALGNTLAGVVVDGPGWRASFLLVAAVAGLGALVLVRGRGGLVPADGLGGPLPA